MSEKEKMISGKLYDSSDEELVQDRKRASELCYKYNFEVKTQEERNEILKKLFKSCGENIYITPTFKCDYGYNIEVGENFYANYDCIILDICNVKIGNNVMLAPRVCIYSATHPIDAFVRNSYLEYGKPVIIEDDVWIGGNSVINPGVKIGKGSIVASGSVVVKDVLPNTIVGGNPAKVIREITDKDKEYWMNMREEYFKDVNCT